MVLSTENPWMPPLNLASKDNPRILCIIHKDEPSPIAYPPSLVSMMKDDSEPLSSSSSLGDIGVRHVGGYATWGDVMVQMKRRLAWTEDGFDMDVLDADRLTPEALSERAEQADIFFFIGLGKNITANEVVAKYTQVIPTGVCLSCHHHMPEVSRIDYQPASVFAPSWTQGKKHHATGEKGGEEGINIPFLPPWAMANQLGRTLNTVEDLFGRGNHLDLYYAMLVLINEVQSVDLVGAKSKLDGQGLFCLLRNCRRPLFKCLGNPTCKKCVDELDKVGLRDQVRAYKIIRSYQSPEFERLSLCINEKHNCLRNDASRPELPDIAPMKMFRGEPLTKEAAEEILLGSRRKNNDSSWMLVCGQNPAYDEFPCQYQVFYRGRAKNSLWYNPVFKVNTLDGNEVWRRSDYKVRHVKDTPGKMIFTFCDNGVTSQEYWHIVDASDDLSWAVLYYSGAAKTAGQAYLGAMLATPDGKWPDRDQIPRITEALERAGIPWHEMVQVCNDFCQDAPLTPLHPERVNAA